MKPLRAIFNIATLLFLLLGLPLVGVAVAGKPVDRYLEFPPVTRYVEHAPFSWAAFAGLGIFIGLFLSPFLLRIASSRRPCCPMPPRRAFPWWGWLGVATGIAVWIIAWNRFPCCAAVQRFTFTPLWLAYIVVINALTWRRTGTCMMVRSQGVFLALFPVSAFFWWFFEYLNRFVQNWYYVGVTSLTPLNYFIEATFPFSTVLPAVLGTCDFLSLQPGLAAGLDSWHPTHIARPRTAAAAWLLLCGIGLALVGVFPDVLFPLLWISPLGILTALQVLQGRQTLFAPLARGDWSRVWLLAMSALMCGFFWELWNYHSLAKWIYAVPYVGRFRIFEMPVLGYAGYLPFGLECAVIGDMVRAFVERKKPG